MSENKDKGLWKFANMWFAAFYLWVFPIMIATLGLIALFKNHC
tara:strand:- start:134 stop:262 length:129 start_codon:yes stop_codon:yes gene_type:complete